MSFAAATGTFFRPICNPGRARRLILFSRKRVRQMEGPRNKFEVKFNKFKLIFMANIRMKLMF